MEVTFAEQEIHQAVPKQVEEVLDRCNKDDPAPEDVKALKQYLRTYPDLWQRFGDMAEHVMNAVFKPLSERIVYVESLKQARLTFRQEFGFDESSPFEKMLIEHVIVCWFQMQFISVVYSSSISGENSLQVKDYYCRRLSAAQRRFLRACETLTRIRRTAMKSTITNLDERRIDNGEY